MRRETTLLAIYHPSPPFPAERGPRERRMFHKAQLANRQLMIFSKELPPISYSRGAW
jgi:hypothetical protein